MFEVEAIEITLAMHMLGLEKKVEKVTISIDNQVVIKSLDIHKPTSSQHIIDEFLPQAETKWKQMDKSQYKLEITWIKGHVDVEGNNKADEEPKKAAREKMMKACNLPTYLATNKLPMSMAAAKQEFRRRTKERWKTKWESSPRYLKLSRIDPTMLSNKYTRLTEDLLCTQARILIQLRMGHIALNDYLHRITKSDTHRCPSC
jgi:ribonuclease HI